MYKIMNELSGCCCLHTTMLSVLRKYFGKISKTFPTRNIHLHLTYLCHSAYNSICNSGKFLIIGAFSYLSIKLNLI